MPWNKLARGLIPRGAALLVLLYSTGLPTVAGLHAFPARAAEVAAQMKDLVRGPRPSL